MLTQAIPILVFLKFVNSAFAVGTCIFQPLNVCRSPFGFLPDRGSQPLFNCSSLTCKGVDARQLPQELKRATSVCLLNITNSRFPKDELSAELLGHVTTIRYLHVTDSGLRRIAAAAVSQMKNLKGIDVTRNELVDREVFGVVAALNLTNPHLEYLLLGQQFSSNTSSAQYFNSSYLSLFKGLVINFLDVSDMSYFNYKGNFWEGFDFLQNVSCISLAFQHTSRDNVEVESFKDMWRARNLLYLDYSYLEHPARGMQRQLIVNAYRKKSIQYCVDAITEELNPQGCKGTVLSDTTINFLVNILRIQWFPQKLRYLLVRQTEYDVKPQGNQWVFGSGNMGIQFNTSFSRIDLSSYGIVNFIQPETVTGAPCMEHFAFADIGTVRFTNKTFLKMPLLKTVDISNNFLPNDAVLQPGTFVSNPLLSSLNISRCNLSCEQVNTPRSSWWGSTVRLLYVADNPLNCFPYDLINSLPNVQVVDLSRHHVKFFTDFFLSSMKRLAARGIRVYLRGQRPFQCVCNTVTFSVLHWFHSPSAHSVADLNDMRCTRSDGRIFNITNTLPSDFENWCRTPVRYDYMVASAVGISGVALIVMVTLCVCRRSLRLWLMKRRARRSRLSTQASQHVALLYARCDVDPVVHIREALLESNFNLFDPDVGLIQNRRLMVAEIHEIDITMQEELQHTPMGITYLDDLCWGITNASVILIMTSQKAQEDDGFRSSCQKTLLLSAKIPVILFKRPEESARVATGSWSVLRRLRQQSRALLDVGSDVNESVRRAVRDALSS